MTAAWHDTARAMRAKRMSVPEIASALDKTATTVAWALNENGERDRQLNRNRAYKRKGPHTIAEAERSAPHVSRQPRRILPADPEIMALCRQFAAGEFDRGELARRLRGEG